MIRSISRSGHRKVSAGLAWTQPPLVAGNSRILFTTNSNSSSSTPTPETTGPRKVLGKAPTAAPLSQREAIKDDDDWVYSKERDPMAGLSEEEKETIKKEIGAEGRRAYSIGYGIIGGGMMVVID
ncbi:hypothetical protein HDU76_000954 [Blyttiomyces sp. JEL0837]|nr:hypothetical protein HDU76_000954 [Blyttiomyces sp. JEL0837]